MKIITQTLTKGLQDNLKELERPNISKGMRETRQNLNRYEFFNVVARSDDQEYCLLS